MRKYFTPVFIIIDSIILSSLSVFFSIFDATGKSQHWCARNWGKSILWGAGIKLSVEGESNIKGDGPYIFASNHQSYVDIWVVLSVIPCSFRFMAKKSLFNWPFIGWHMRRSGYIPLDREKSTSGARSLLNAVKKIKNGTNVLVFPEGTRTPPNTLGEFKKGAFYMAAKTGVPLIPIIMKNTAAIYPNKGIFVYPGKVEVKILPPIETKDFGPKKVDELMEYTRNVISQHYPTDADN